MTTNENAALARIDQEHSERLLALASEESRLRARRGLLNFICFTHPQYEVNWHHVVVCRMLNAFARGEIKRLIITMPPRHGKSEIVSRRLPAYLLGRNPDMEIMAASYGSELAKAMNRDVQRIMTGEHYMQLFPGTRLNGRNIRTTAQGNWVRNSDMFEVVERRGRYQCAGIGGPLTGKGADCAIIDDPVRNWQDANSPTYRERCWDWYGSTLYSRLSKDAGICITTTRWHEDDLAGRLISLMETDPEADQWTVLNLEAVKETPPNAWDTRSLGQPLWEARFPAARLGLIKKNSTRIWQALYQGDPTPPGGNIVKEAWWQYFRKADLPTQMAWWRISCDLTFKDKEKSDFTVMQVWGGKGANRYLVDQLRERAGFIRQCQMLLQLVGKHPYVGGVLVEDTANGPALINALRDKVSGLIPVDPEGSKLSRAEACSPAIEAGNVFLPHPSDAPWVPEYLEEWNQFPAGKNDDQVDATSQVLLRMGTVVPENLIIPMQTKRSRWKEKLGV